MLGTLEHETMSPRIMSIGAHPTAHSVEASMIDRGHAGMKSIAITKFISTLQLDLVSNGLTLNGGFSCRSCLLLVARNRPLK